MSNVTLGEDRIDSERADPGTAEDSTLDRLEAIEARTLLTARAQERWSLESCDLDADRRDWPALDAETRAAVVATLVPVFSALDRDVRLFAALPVASADEDERAFLSAQREDETLHARVFAAMLDGWAPSETERVAAQARCELAFADLFDPRAQRTMARLEANPGDVAAKVEAVAMHHLVVKALLGLTATHFAADYCTQRGILPGLGTALHHVKRDLHRQVAWATWWLRNRMLADAGTGPIVERALMELLPVVVSVLIEGGMAACCEGTDSSEFLGYSSAELNYYALMALVRRLRVMGGETTEIQQFAASGAWRASRLMAAERGRSHSRG